jgi:SsrA-binding protein
MAEKGKQVIATNRRARHEYSILEELEAGIVLRGSEVKSLRLGHVQINDGYCRIVNDELWLIGVNISAYAFAHGFGSHLPDQQRKLLLKRYEIDRLSARINQERLTLIPLSIYFKDGRAKIELGLAKGRTKGDKRQVLAERDADREIQKAMGRARKGIH